MRCTRPSTIPRCARSSSPVPVQSFCAGADLKAISRRENLFHPEHGEWGFAGLRAALHRQADHRGGQRHRTRRRHRVGVGQRPRRRRGAHQVRSARGQARPDRRGGRGVPHRRPPAAQGRDGTDVHRRADVVGRRAEVGSDQPGGARRHRRGRRAGTGRAHHRATRRWRCGPASGWPRRRRRRDHRRRSRLGAGPCARWAVLRSEDARKGRWPSPRSASPYGKQSRRDR